MINLFVTLGVATVGLFISQDLLTCGVYTGLRVLVKQTLTLFFLFCFFFLKLVLTSKATFKACSAPPPGLEFSIIRSSCDSFMRLLKWYSSKTRSYKCLCCCSALCSLSGAHRNVDVSGPWSAGGLSCSSLNAPLPASGLSKV